MPPEVLPYLVPQQDTVQWEPWSLLDVTGWRHLPEEIDGWDPGTNLYISRNVQIDVHRFRRETGLYMEDIGLTVSWTSSTTDMTEAAPSVRFDSQGLAVVEALLVGTRLSGTLTIRSTVSLVRTSPWPDVAVANTPGSVLTSHTQRVVLETLSSMFAVHEIDFAYTRLSPMASWHLETSTDLLAPFFGTFRVLVNKQDRELSAAVLRGAKDRRQQAIVDELQAGVTALLLELALHLQHDLCSRIDWPIDSVGDVLSRLMSASQMSTVAPASPTELADLRTQISGAVRHLGKGRLFQ
jgi:hypothetical protein